MGWQSKSVMISVMESLSLLLSKEGWGRQEEQRCWRPVIRWAPVTFMSLSFSHSPLLNSLKPWESRRRENNADYLDIPQGSSILQFVGCFLGSFLALDQNSFLREGRGVTYSLHFIAEKLSPREVKGCAKCSHIRRVCPHSQEPGKP